MAFPGVCPDLLIDGAFGSRPRSTHGHNTIEMSRENASSPMTGLTNGRVAPGACVLGKPMIARRYELPGVRILRIPDWAGRRMAPNHILNQERENFRFVPLMLRR